MANDTDKKEISFIEVEEVLKKNKVRTRTLFTRKSRKLSDVLDDLSEKWYKISKEDKKSSRLFGWLKKKDKDVHKIQSQRL